MKFLEIVLLQAKATRISYGCAYNIYDIAKERHEATTGDESLVWRDLMTRSQWFWRFLSRRVYPTVQEILGYLKGPKQPELVQLRLRWPVSFTAEPCAACKKLEDSFKPNDQELRTPTKPFWDQYILCFDHLVATSFSVLGTGKFNKIELDKIISTITDPVEVKAAKLSYLLTKASEDFQAYGRSCFSQTEISWQQKYKAVADVREMEIDTFYKYYVTGPETFKAFTGLYALNKSAVCAKCTPLIEKRAIGFKR